MYKTRKEVKIWLEEVGIENYVINEDLTVDVDGNVDIYYCILKNLPIRFGKVNGCFNCNNNELTTLEGFPQVVNGDFSCGYNNLSSLKGCPKEINGSFFCNSNNLTNLEGCPEVIHGDFNCCSNSLTSLLGCPKEITASFDCSGNSFINLQYCCQKIGNDFNCSSNNLTNLEGCLEVIHGDFDCSDNLLTNLESFPKLIISKKIDMSANSIKEEELINFNCDVSVVNKIYSDFNTSGNKEDFLEKVNYYKNIQKEELLFKEICSNVNTAKINKKL